MLESPGLPKEVLFDATYGKHASNIASRADQLDAKMRPFLNDLVTIIRVLRWSRIGIPFDIRRYQLWELVTNCKLAN